MDRLEPTLFEKSSPGRRGCHPPTGGVALVDPVAVLGVLKTVRVPKALQAYLGGRERLGRPLG